MDQRNDAVQHTLFASGCGSPIIATADHEQKCPGLVVTVVGCEGFYPARTHTDDDNFLLWGESK